jgi:hypothetical protein
VTIDLQEVEPAIIIEVENASPQPTYLMVLCAMFEA